jgi:cytochrome c6
MQRLPLATRPPVPFHDAFSSCFVVPRGKAACCCCSLKQERPDRAAHFAVAAIAGTVRTAAPFLAAALLLAAGPPGLPASIPPGFSNPSLLVLRITDVMHVKNAGVANSTSVLD